VIPSMIRKFLEARDAGNRSVTSWADGSPTREFLSTQVIVLEPSHSLSSTTTARNRSILDPARRISILELALLIAELTVRRPNQVGRLAAERQPRRALSTDRARDLFGFAAEVPLRLGLERTIAWYESARSGTGMS
jgi:GDP-L-fucose synthase